MWPWLIEQPFRLGSYGAMLTLAFVVCGHLARREWGRRAMPGGPPLAWALVGLAAVTGVLGARLAYLWTEAPSWSWSDLFSSSGLTWHGGLILAGVSLTILSRVRGVPWLPLADLLAPLLALGYGIGRIGCHLAGDGDYGIPCNPGWWRDHVCMTYPAGIVPSPCLIGERLHEVCPVTPLPVTFVPVHPTPIYEAVGGMAIFALLWALRRRLEGRLGASFSIWLVLAGAFRLAVEFLRLPEQRPLRALGLRDAQWVSLTMIGMGVILGIWAWTRRKGTPVPSPNERTRHPAAGGPRDPESR